MKQRHYLDYFLYNEQIQQGNAMEPFLIPSVRLLHIWLDCGLDYAL